MVSRILDLREEVAGKLTKLYPEEDIQNAQGK
jgi:hypothetical protein